eukprot:COSAG01_NODE_201_length_22135_cov_408.324288_10_plen_83_part_00
MVEQFYAHLPRRNVCGAPTPHRFLYLCFETQNVLPATATTQLEWQIEQLLRPLSPQLNASDQLEQVRLPQSSQKLSTFDGHF